MPTEEISAAEAARRLRVEMAYLYSLLWTGKLAARKVNGRWLVSVEAVRTRLEGRMKND
jgi:hypothetical protein